VLSACGGSNASIDLYATDGGANTTPDGGGVGDNLGTVSFNALGSFLTRGQWCGEPPPFTSQDFFALTLFATTSSSPEPRPTVRIIVYATASVGTPRALSVLPWKPGPAPKPGDNDINQEEAIDDQKNPKLVFSLSRGMEITRPDPNAFDTATMTVLAMPTAEHESLKVRVQLHFTDGQTLDQTFTSEPLDEQSQPCGGRADQ
jgi:hypothetical protein